MTETVAIIDYGSGNLRSAQKAFERMTRERELDRRVILTSKAEDVRHADRVVLPGVGAFADCKAGLAAVPGMIEALDAAVIRAARPFLGICVGMQLMATRGLEKTVTEGLGWIPGDVVKIAPRDPAFCIPHMGWNTITARQHKVLDRIAAGPTGLHAYFVHSYHVETIDKNHTLAEADYGGPVTAMVGRDNLVGTQFHPEKSQRLGLSLIANFLEWAP